MDKGLLSERARALLGLTEGRPSASAGHAVTVRVADVARRQVGWLWPGRVPAGKLTLVAGDPGIGKSLMALDMAARTTTGRPWPDAEDVERGSVEDGSQGAGDHPDSCAPVGLPDRAAVDTAGQASRGTAGASPSRQPGSVILLSAEDDVADTIRPRLEAAGADLRRVVILQSVWRPGPSGTTDGPFSLAADLDALEGVIQRTGDVRLVIIDPLGAYLGRTDSHKDSQVRSLLGFLGKLAERRGVAILAVTHLNKNAAKSVLYRAMGSLAFVAAARAVWAVVRDPELPGRHLFLPVKCNLAGQVMGLAYTIADSREFPGTPVIAWEREPVALGADEAMAAQPSGPGAVTERQQAAAWLRELLAAGPVPAREVKRRADEAGFSWATIKRAKPLARVEPYSTGQRAAWEWRLAHQCGSPGSNVAHTPEVSHIGAGETH